MQMENETLRNLQLSSNSSRTHMTTNAPSNRAVDGPPLIPFASTSMLDVHEEPFTWETAVVSTELVCALALAMWMMHRKASRDTLILGSAYPTMKALSPLVQPNFRICSLRMLVYYRAMVLAFYVMVQCYDIYRTEGKCLVFYTSWNFMVQGTYFACALFHTMQLRQQQAERPMEYEALVDEHMHFIHERDLLASTRREQQLTASSYGHAARRRGWFRLDLVLDVCLATSILIGLVVWTILYPYAVKVHMEHKLLNWVSYCQHGVNIALLLLDFALTQHLVCVDALSFMIVWPTLYTIFTWIVHGTVAHGFWPYPFMKLDTPTAPLWYAGLLLAHLLCFALVYLVSRAKHSYRQFVLREQDLFQRARRASLDDSQDEDEEEQNRDNGWQRLCSHRSDELEQELLPGSAVTGY